MSNIDIEYYGMHVSRTWGTQDKQWFPECFCTEAPCGLVIPHADCRQHGVRFNKTMRRAHRANECSHSI